MHASQLKLDYRYMYWYQVRSFEEVNAHNINKYVKYYIVFNLLFKTRRRRRCHFLTRYLTNTGHCRLVINIDGVISIKQFDDINKSRDRNSLGQFDIPDTSNHSTDIRAYDEEIELNSCEVIETEVNAVENFDPYQEIIEWKSSLLLHAGIAIDFARVMMTRRAS